MAANPKDPEANDLLGLLLTVAYYPLSPTSQAAAPLRRGSAVPDDVQQGLTALRTAATSQPTAPSYHLDYAWALLVSNQREAARDELNAIARRFPALAGPDQDRLRQLQAQAGGRAPQVIAPPPAPTATALPKEISWLSYNDALAAAKRENKQVLIDFMAQWCGWCKRMETSVFPTPEVIALSRKYVFARVDVEREPSLAQKYKAGGLPTFVSVDANGREVKRAVGYQSPKEFVQAFQ